MIISDESDYRRLLRVLFSRDGFTATEASFSHAEAEALRFGPDALIVDLTSTQDRYGLTIAESIVQADPSTPVFVLMGLLTAAAEMIARTDLAFTYFKKPVEPARLLNAVSDATGMRNSCQ